MGVGFPKKTEIYRDLERDRNRERDRDRQRKKQKDLEIKIFATRQDNN